MLALIVELLCVALTGANFGYEADSFFVDEGNQPRLGQAFLVIDPAALAGADVYYSRLEALIARCARMPRFGYLASGECNRRKRREPASKFRMRYLRSYSS